MIDRAFSYCAVDQITVTEFEKRSADKQRAEYWLLPIHEQLRAALKKYYIAEQKTRCCYCNRHLGSENHRIWDLEHIVPRSKHPRFMFEPRNLAASCPDCNGSKKDQETLTNARRKTYPTRSDDFRIVHPHYDVFEQHIHRVGMVYLPKTEKGKNTIYMCDLLRFAQKFIEWRGSASDVSFEAEVDTLFEETAASAIAANEMLHKLNLKE